MKELRVKELRVKASRVKGEGIKLQDVLSRVTRATIVCTLLCLCEGLKVKG